MITDISVGIPAIGGKSWLGGVSFVELHTKAVAALPAGERPKLFLVVTAAEAGNLEFYLPFMALFNGVICVGGAEASMPPFTDIPRIHCADENELFQIIDFYFPASFRVLPHRCAASWIHDFQHRYLPEFFSPQDVARRDLLCRLVADHARLVFCTSRAVENDFRKFFPASAAVTRALPLRVMPEESWYCGDPLLVQAHYHLPAEFILCCNQFWVHKNHWRLLAALALLRRAGRDVHLVCTGATADYRFPSYFQKIKEYIAALGVGDLVHILGLIPREHQIQLLRSCLSVVQPSLFEGLSLNVQECRALGKTIVLSDLDVHRELGYGVYFDRHSVDDLAAKIAAVLDVALPGPDERREAEARMQAQALCTAYAKQFCALAEEAVALFAGPGKVPPPWTPAFPGAIVPLPEKR